MTSINNRIALACFFYMIGNTLSCGESVDKKKRETLLNEETEDQSKSVDSGENKGSNDSILAVDLEEFPTLAGSNNSSAFSKAFANPNSGRSDIYVSVDLGVSGYSTHRSLANIWPITPGSNLKMYSYNNNSNVKGKLQIKNDGIRTYQSVRTAPLDFVKSHQEIYWGPEGNQNLRWHVIPFDISSSGYFWAKGDERYPRSNTKIELQRKFRYNSLTNLPSYPLYPKRIKPNPGNDGLTNSYLNRHKYESCNVINGECQFQTPYGEVSWFTGVRRARIKMPSLGNGFHDVYWIEHVELSIGSGENLSAPYNSNRSLACAKNSNGSFKYTGVREDWFFKEGIGPVLILQRHINSGSRGDCVHDVVRQTLNFENADTVSILIRKDHNGFDPNWDY